MNQSTTKIIITLAFITSIFIFTGCNKITGETGFNSAEWKAQYNKFEEIDNPRIKMVAELTDSILKKGMQKDKVRELLGTPEVINENKDTYYLGVSSYGIDFEHLEIEYDSEDKVVSFRITRT